MASQLINLGATGLHIGDCTFSWCKKQSDNSDVDHSGATLTERANGFYVLVIAGITEPVDFYIYETSTAGNYAIGVLTPSPALAGDKMDLVDAPNVNAIAALYRALLGIAPLNTSIWQELETMLTNINDLFLAAPALGSDEGVLISTDVQDLSATLKVNAGGADIATIKADIEDGTHGLAALAALIGNISISGVWNALLSGMSTTGSIGKKLADWVLGTDNKVLLSSDAQTGVTIPTVTSVSNPVTVSPFQVVSGVIQNRFNVVLDETLGPFKRGDTIPSGAITFNFGSDYAALSDDKMYFCVKLDPTGTKLVDLQCTYTDRANCAGYVPLIDLEAAGIDPVDQYYEFSQMNAAGTAKVTPTQGIFAVEQDVRQLT